MRALLDAADKAGGYHLVAGCDVYEPRRDQIRERSTEPVSTCNEYRELLDKKDMDAVIIAAPDHWHVRIACDALAAGKHIYLEKPVSHTIAEGELLTKAVRQTKFTFQCGMQQRSWTHFTSAVELIRAGNIGRITQVRTYWFQNYQSTTAPQPIETSQLDWKRWLGAAADQPFTEEKYRHWRWFWDFGGGAMTDLFTHWIDVVHWAMNTSEPLLVQTIGDRYFFEEWDCPDTVQASLRYKTFEVGYEGTMVSSVDDGGLEFRGTTGSLKLNRSGFSIYREDAPRGSEAVLNERSTRDGTITHMQNFFNCIRDRKEPNAPVEAGVAAARAGHLANQSYRQGTKLSLKS
jgi:predicted dehydrogenase